MTRQQKKTLKMALSYLVIVLIGCLLLFPIAWMISCAFKTNEEIFGSIALLPKSFSFQNFVDGWKSAGSYTYLTYFLRTGRAHHRAYHRVQRTGGLRLCPV